MGQKIKILKFEAKKHKFDQHKNPISMYDVSNARIVVLNQVRFGKMVLNILLGTKKLCPCVLFFQISVHIEQILDKN